MKNFRQPGHAIYVAAPSGGVTAGAGVHLNNIFGIASVDAAEGVVFALYVTGVFELPKVAAETWHVGDYIYWSVSQGKATNGSPASGDPTIGVAVAAPPYTTMPVNPSDYGDVRLNGTF